MRTGGTRAAASDFWGATARASPNEEKANDGAVHTRRSRELAGSDARSQSNHPSRRVRRSGRAFPLAANAKRRAEALQDRHAIRALSHSSERIKIGTAFPARGRLYWDQFDRAAQDRRVR